MLTFYCHLFEQVTEPLQALGSLLNIICRDDLCSFPSDKLRLLWSQILKHFGNKALSKCKIFLKQITFNTLYVVKCYQLMIEPDAFKKLFQICPRFTNYTVTKYPILITSWEILI